MKARERTYSSKTFLLSFAGWCKQFQFGDERGSWLASEELKDRAEVRGSFLPMGSRSLAACGRWGQACEHTCPSEVSCHVWNCPAGEGGTDAPATGVLRKSVCCKIIINNKKKSMGTRRRGSRTG